MRAVIALQRQWPGHGCQRALDLGCQHGAHLVGGNFLIEPPLRKGLGNAHGRFNAKVCLNQGVLKFLQGISVELPLGKNARDVLRQAA